MTNEEAIELLSKFNFEKMSISGDAEYVGDFLGACVLGYEAIQKLQKIEERMSNVITMLSVQAEQNKIIFAEDFFEVLEDIFPNWNEKEQEINGE
ncbi:MAG: hypothetical protein MJZ37_07980 [Bacilli bacterium]|nr:hypothetical protein [Bacilli bacterium]